MNKQKFYLYLCVIFCFFIYPVLPVKAAEVTKTISVTLPDDYLQCGFYITFEKANSNLPKAIVTDPQGREFPAEIDLVTGEYKATLKNVKAGEYTVTITKEISDYTSLAEDDFNNMNQSALADSEIGKVTVNVKAETETTKPVTNELRLTKEISGLIFYWKDDNLVVSWDDETIGNINITVVNSKTLQVLDNQIVSGQYYEFPIVPGVDEIMLTIVPTVSQNVLGAGDEYILKVSNQPEGSVIFDKIEYTNKDTIHATVHLQKEYSLIYENNGEKVGSTDILPIGTHEIEIPTVDGNNQVKVYLVDKQHNMRSTSISFIKDTSPPVIKIVEDIDGISTKEDFISFTGIVEDYDTLTFRNEEVSVEWDGTFKIQVPLKDGKNELILTAADKAGNIITYTAIVEKYVPDSMFIPWYFILFFIGPLILILLFVIFRKFNIFFGSIQKKNKNIKQEKPLKTSKLKKRKTVKSKENISEYICLVINIFIYLVLIYGVFQFAIVKSSSMSPTIYQSEFIIANRLAYKIKEPKRGDVITFMDKNSQVIMLKRIIGLPGDQISFVNGYLFVNNYMCDETAYLNTDIETNSNKTFTVPENSYFVLGDNRENSHDSRYWESPYVEKEQIYGKMFMHIDISNIFNLSSKNTAK